MEKNFARELSSQRGALMGLAICMIMCYHLGFGWAAIDGFWPVQLVKDCGFAGVDIFLLLSGYGVYYSLNKNSTAMFYRHRFTRLLVPYIPFVLLWFLWYAPGRLSSGQLVKALFGNLLMSGWWLDMGCQFNWYVQVQAWLYVFSPLLYALLGAPQAEKSTAPRQLAVLALSVVFGLPFLNGALMIGVSRIPIFVLGMVAAKRSLEPPRAQRLVAGCVYGAAVPALLVFCWFWRNRPDTLWLWGTYWYPFLFIAPVLCLLAGKLFALAEKHRATAAVRHFFVWAGSCSFEIYLWHMALWYATSRYEISLNNPLRGALLVLALALGGGWHALGEAAKKQLAKRTATAQAAA